MDNKEFFLMPEDEVKPVKKETKLSEDIVSKVETEVKVNKDVPNGYVKFELDSTKGRLFAPKFLHFRNFYLEDIKELVQYSDGIELFNRLISILTRMNYENFDCSKLHMEELKEIMVRLYVNFISSKLKNMKYKKDESLPFNKDNTSYVDIDLTKLDIKELSDKVKGTFSIKLDNDVNESVTFSFPVVEHLVLSNKLVEEFLKSDKDKVETIKNKQETIENIESKITTINKTLFEVEGKLLREDLKEEQKTALNIQRSMLKSELSKCDAEKNSLELNKEELKFIDDYDNKKKLLYIEIYQKLSIVKVNGKELSLLEKANLNIDFRYFLAYNKFINEQKFGIDNTYTFFCPHAKEMITRSFPFRINELIPSMGLSNDTGYDICFD